MRGSLKKNLTINKVAPIPTFYRGQKFRSRLEARFAVFFDCLRCEWTYEPEGFSLPSGGYLPDFFLPHVGSGVWLEVKPWAVNSYFGWNREGNCKHVVDERLYDFCDFAHSRNQDFYVTYGLPDDRYFLEHCDYTLSGYLESPYDAFRWCICPCGKTLGIEFDGRGARINCECNKKNDSDKHYSYDHIRIVVAAQTARNYRFIGEKDECICAPDISFLNREDMPEEWKNRLLDYFYGNMSNLSGMYQ